MNKFYLIALFTLIVNMAKAQVSITTNIAGNICKGKSKNLTANVSFGTGPYTYAWTPATGLNATTTASVIASPIVNTIYTLTVTDANNVANSTTINVVLFPILNAAFTKTNLSCYLLNNGSVNIDATGGTTPYTYAFSPSGYLWAGIPDSSTYNPIGTYTATVTDANGCSLSSSLTLTQPSPISASVVTKNIVCNGQINGGGYTTATGGTPYQNGITEPYNVYWYTPTQTYVTYGDTVTNLGAGTYHVFVTDSNNCNSYPTLFQVVTLTNPTIVKGAPVVTTPISCNGNTNGVVTVTGSGGTVGSGYTYRVNGGAYSSTNTFNSLSAATYTFTTRDGNLCIRDSIFTVTQPTILTSSVTTLSAIACNGGNGSVSVTATGGTAPYTNTGTKVSIGGANTYTVTDSRGCTANTSINIAQPAAIVINASVTQPLCAGNQGSIAASATNGVGTVTITINGSAPAASYASGNYTILAVDANSCSTNTVVVINPTPALITITPTIIQPKCFGEKGSVSFATIGGSGTITITPNTFSNLNAGNYTYTATDANNCSKSITITINNAPSAISLTSNISQPLCNGALGSVAFTASGGTGAINILPSNNTNLIAGGYTYTATDANNCTVSTTITINNAPPVIVLTPTVSQPLCAGNLGNINISPSGGAGVFTVTVNGVAPAVSYAPGSYTVVATDFNLCTASSVVTINAIPTLISLTSIVTQPKCFGEKGSVNLTTSGGTGTINISPNTYANLNAGTYIFTATDANNCGTTLSVLINAAPTAIVITPSISQPLCNGDLGSITFTTTGGTGLIGILPTNTINLASGAYTYTATDINNCSVATTINILAAPSIITINAAVQQPVCVNQNGTITASAIGGSGAITYTLNGNSFVNSFTTNITGTYTLNAKDANNCSTSIILVLNPGGASPLVVNVANATNPSCFGENNGSISLATTNGVAPYSYTISPMASSLSVGVFNSLGAGTYNVSVTDAVGCSKSLTYSITAPSAINFTTIQTAVADFCIGNNGSISVLAAGGVGALSLSSNPNLNKVGNNFVGASVGNYTVLATDVNNCTQTTLVAVTATNSLTLNAIANNPTCFGSNNGSISVTANGGRGALNYTISPSAIITGQGAYNSLYAGSYTLTVTDIAGCTSTQAISLNNPPQMNILFAVQQPKCNGSANGSVVANTVGGSGLKTYTISPSKTQPVPGNFINVNSGLYLVTAIDAAGCTRTTVLPVTQPTSLNFTSITKTNVTCFGNATGSIVAVVGGGVGLKSLSSTPTLPFTFPATLNGAAFGVYTIQTKDANNCTKTTTVSINQPNAIAITSPILTHPTTGNNGSIVISAVGGSGGKTYSINPNGALINPGQFGGLVAGAYTLTATDANGCIATSIATLTNATPLIKNALESSEVLSTTSVSVYPNPFYDRLQIKFTSDINDNLEVYLYSNDGRLVKKQKFKCNTGINNLDFQALALPLGLYTIQVRTSNNKAYNYKLLKQ